MEWCTKIMHKHLKGITLNHTRHPYEQVIRGFRGFALLFKEKKKGNGKLSPKDMERRFHGCRRQIITMGIITATRQYNELIAQGELVVHPSPSWEAIDFSNDADEMECARHLAS
jgi:hypothetical protein